MNRVPILVVMFVAMGVMTGGCNASDEIPGVQSNNGQPAPDPQGNGGRSDQGEIADAAAKAVVERMFAAYAECKLYSDTGTLVVDDTRMTFLTRFKRPDRIYFEFTALNNVRDGRFVYWAQGVREKIWTQGVDGPSYWDDTVLTNVWYGDHRAFEEDTPLHMAIAGFTGISLGTGRMVPGLLLPDEISLHLWGAMADIVFEGTAVDRGVECDVLYSRKWLTRVWIDKKTHLLRRMTDRFGESDAEIVTEYLPTVDVEIKDELMVFEPPE